jgi:hypothetical protein
MINISKASSLSPILLPKLSQHCKLSFITPYHWLVSVGPWEEPGEDGTVKTPLMRSAHSLTFQLSSEACREKHAKCEFNDCQLNYSDDSDYLRQAMMPFPLASAARSSE